MSFKPTYSFRLSFATVQADKSLSASVALSKEEVKQLTNVTADDKISPLELNEFWPRIGKNQFCMPDGGVINSTTTLGNYIAAARRLYPKELKTLAALADSPVYTVCYKETVQVPLANKSGDSKLDLKLHTFESPAQQFGPLPESRPVDPNSIANPIAGAAFKRPGQMTTDDWNEVMVANSLLNGFLVNRDTQTVDRAPKTAFKLEPNPIHPYKFSPGTVRTAEVAKLKKRAKAAISAIAPVALVIQSLKLEPRSSSASRRRQQNSGAKINGSTPPGGKGDIGRERKGGKGGDKKDDKGGDTGSESGDDKPDAGDPLQHLYPMWEVCDDSMVKIETISTTLQLASAQQGFSSASVEAAFSATTPGYMVDVSAGFSFSSTTARSSETGQKTEQMHATYEFPRVRVHLNENCISLSDDCAAAVSSIMESYSFQELKDFYANYGHLYVTRVKLGGRLRATRHLSAEEAKDQGSAENSWKTSIAASFSTVMTTTDAKATAEGASKTEQRSASSVFRESVCWEAHGGDTTLANNPGAWCPTVTDFSSWRVVDQEVVLPIEDVISKLPSFAEVRTVFADIMMQSYSSFTANEMSWNGADGASLGRGIASVGVVQNPGDFLKDSLFKPTNTSTMLVPTDLPFQWSVIVNNRDLRQYIADAFEDAISPYVGTKLFPSYVWRLGLSDRAFSVVLRIRRDLERSTATFSLAGALPKDDSKWKLKLGDRYIDSILRGVSTTVVWTFVPELPYPQQLAVLRDVASFFSTPAALYQVGCARLAALAGRIPCETYLYDAYYNETRIHPSAVIAALGDTNAAILAKKVLSVGLKPYRESPLLQSAAAGIIPAPPVLALHDLRAVRRDYADYAFEAAKRRPDITPVAPSSDVLKNWSTDFSRDEFNKGLADPGGNHGASVGIAQSYNALFGGQTPTAPLDSRMLKWNLDNGDESGLERLLRWLRMSRREEIKQLTATP